LQIVDCGLRIQSRNQSAICNLKSAIEDLPMPTVFKGRVFAVEVEKRAFPNGREHQVEIVRHRPSVVLIPIEDDGRVVLVRQYRAPIDRMTWEFPAGSLDEGESAEAAARRVSCAWLLRRGDGVLQAFGPAVAAAGFTAHTRRG
jgi:hypothetical protein